MSRDEGDVMHAYHNRAKGNEMSAKALVQTRIDAGVKARATTVLEELGITVSEAVRILLTRTANEGALPFPVQADAAHDAWFRAKVQEALDDPRPALSDEQVSAHFARRRAAALKKAKVASETGLKPLGNDRPRGHLLLHRGG